MEPNPDYVEVPYEASVMKIYRGEYLTSVVHSQEEMRDFYSIESSDDLNKFNAKYGKRHSRK